MLITSADYSMKLASITHLLHFQTGTFVGTLSCIHLEQVQGAGKVHCETISCLARSDHQNEMGERSLWPLF